jgi:acyl-CoA thioesterase-2
MSMRAKVAQLVKHVDAHALEAPRRFVGRSADLGWGRIYGGQTMAQGLAACQQAAGLSKPIHHFSCHFLRGGDPEQSIEFEVDKLSSGRSFSCFHLRALQKINSSSAAILAMTASFQAPEIGLQHQVGGLLPEWKRPEELQPLTELMEQHLHMIPKRIQPLFVAGGTPFDLRPVELSLPWDESTRPPWNAVWLRTHDALPDEDHVHERVLTYISDWSLLESALFPHPTAVWRPDVQCASLSHSIHFHRPFRVDDWLCYAYRSPTTSGGRGLCVGEFWTASGDLVASVTQEGLIRMRPDRAK